MAESEVVDEPKVEPEAAPEAEPETPPAPEPEPEVVPEPDPEPAEGEPEPEKQPSRRESLRIQQLLTKLKEKEAAPQRRTEGGLDYKTALEADDETVKALDADRRAYGDMAYREGLEEVKSSEFRINLNIDAPRVSTKYPALDPESPKFNPVVASTLNEMYMSTVGWNPQTRRVANANIRYADYIEGIMELSDEVASERVTQSAKNIAKQAATTGLRPSGGTSKRMNLNQAPRDMNDEELKAKIAQELGI